MSEWFWVALGFTVAYGSVAGYFVVMARRRAAVRRQVERLR